MLARGRGGILHIGSGVGRLFLAGAATSVGAHRCLDGFLESLRLEVEGTGVVVTQAVPGPLEESEEVEARTGTRPFFQISAEQCAREVLAGFEFRVPLVYPGWGHHWVMTLLPMLPRTVRRVLGRLAARSLQLPPEPARALLAAHPAQG
jgi:short-subunit dehydrogenase